MASTDAAAASDVYVLVVNMALLVDPFILGNLEACSRSLRCAVLLEEEGT